MWKKIELTSLQKRMLLTLIFLLRLLVLSIPLYAVLTFSQILNPLQLTVAGQIEFMLRVSGLNVSREGAYLSVFSENNMGFAFVIDQDCTGWKSLLFFSALVFAVPAVKNKKRFYGIAAGLPVIWVANLFRIFSAVLAGLAYGPETASFLHDFLWQFGLISLVLGLWFAWLRWFSLKV